MSERKRASVIRCVRCQTEHRRKITCLNEFVLFLKKHGVAYGERYAWE